MAQNTSYAVMQQRHEAHDSLDDFPTPPWAGRALCEHVLKPLGCFHQAMSVWEPACNRGYLARGLSDYFRSVFVSDIFDYGIGARVCDFLFEGMSPGGPVDLVITNPPFRLAHAFIDHARDVAEAGAAMLVRTSFLEGVNRYESLFSSRPPTVIAQFAERVPMVKGRCDPEASTATSYCWIVWTSGPIQRTEFMWIPPCRKKLEREGDYA